MCDALQQGGKAPDGEVAIRIRREAARLGFAAIGFASPDPQPLAMQRVDDMVSEHRSGDLNYIAEGKAERADPSLLLPGLHTIVSAAISYNVSVSYVEGVPKISRYALLSDYHTIVRRKLEELLEVIRAIVGEPLNARITVDSAPVLEKNWAEQAGIGKTGKNTLLKVPSAGSWIFLGEILVDRLIREQPHVLPNYCGSCGECLEHCPTGALVSPGKIDASRCISYLTIELKRDFTPEEAAMIGEWMFGCDRCQEVCPYNRQATIQGHEAFQVRPELLELTTDQILGLGSAGFRKLFYGTPIYRIGLRRLKRNARAVADNLNRKRSGS